jgi:4-hydroxybenzoate polyprenyltransferase
MALPVLKFFKGLCEAIVYSNVWVAFIGFCLLWSSYLMLSLPFNFYLGIFYFFSILFTYNLQRIYELNKSNREASDPRRIWILNHEPALRDMIKLSGLILLLLCFVIPARVYLYLIPAGLITMLYTFPVGFISSRYKRLREVPGIKIFLVALVWSYSSVAFILADRLLPFQNEGIIFVFLLHFFLCTAITLPFDIRDVEIDLRNRLKTLVTEWGAIRTLQIASVFALSSIPLVIYQSEFSPGQKIVLTGHAVLSVILISMSIRCQKYELFFTGLLDGLIVLRWIGLMII